MSHSEKSLYPKIKRAVPIPIKKCLRKILGAAGVKRYSEDGPKVKMDPQTIEQLEAGYSRERKARVDEVGIVRDYFAQKYGTSETGRCFVDVGAHQGFSASPFLADGWSVIAFEPDSTNREVLQKKLGSYIPDRLRIEPVAVSDKEEENVQFYRSDVSSGISSLRSFHESHEASETVSITTLAKYSESNGIDRVDFLKIDTEGYDLHVLKGVPWEKWQPEAIVCEFEDKKTEAIGYLWTEMADYLAGHGYKVWVSEWHPIIEYGTAHDWSRLFPYPGEVKDAESWGNLVAFRSKPGPETMEVITNRNLVFRS